MQASARAHSNIALVKYWGKRDLGLNLPAVGSLSVTLDALWTQTSVGFDPSLERDEFSLDGDEHPATAHKVTRALDRMRTEAGVATRARVVSHNNFPTGAGLASSASGFAALTVAADAALRLDLPASRLSELARRGSGSAARSLFGGFVEMRLGEAPDGSDAIARPLLDRTAWPLELVIAVTSTAPKSIGSTDGMTRTADTSPFYPAWVSSGVQDLEDARAAVLGRDFDALAALGEYSCLKMHGLALSARPGLLYWNGATVECLQRIRELRAGGVATFFTVDAGPQVKAICLPGHTDRVAEALRDVAGVTSIVRSGLGPDARTDRGGA